MWPHPFIIVTYSVLRTDGAVGHLLEAGRVEALLDLRQPLDVLRLSDETVDGLEDLARPVDAPLDDVVLVRVGLSVALLQQLLQQQRVLHQALVFHREDRGELKKSQKFWG